MNKCTQGYEVTRDGRVFSTSGWRGQARREMKPDLNDDGYPSVRLTINGKRTRYAVHVLVAEQHPAPRPSPAHEVRHIDGNKLNPNASNLAWGTRKENADDRERHGRTSRGAAHSASIRASNQAEGTLAFRRSQKQAKDRLIAAAPDYHEEVGRILSSHDAEAARVNFVRCGCEICRALRPIYSKATGAEE